VFVPFTVIDHHRSSVTCGAGLLSNETIDSYKWLLQQFLKCHGKQPVLVLTDQDPALKQAIEAVFPNSRHRLCMWHIMKKLKSKVN
jgi:transposase-like protein